VPDVSTGRLASTVPTGTGRSRPSGSARIVADFDSEVLATPVSHPVHDQGRLLAEVTNAIVRLHRQHYGKGPTRSKSYLAGDVVLCVMGDLFTPVERTLLAAGEGERVRSARVAVHDAVGHDFRDAVERIMGRRVITFTSQVLLEPEIGIELFILEPASGAEPVE
jgi:uncharacterized protein YbcI